MLDLLARVAFVICILALSSVMCLGILTIWVAEDSAVFFRVMYSSILVSFSSLGLLTAISIYRRGITIEGADPRGSRSTPPPPA